MKRSVVIPVLSIFVGLVIFYTWQRGKQQADYSFVGKFKYTITSIDSFNNTVLSDNSYGFALGDPSLQGISYESSGLDFNKEYIFSIHHPIAAVYTNSEEVRNQNQRETKERPVEIVQDKSVSDSLSIFVYELRPKGKYRLLLP